MNKGRNKSEDRQKCLGQCGKELKLTDFYNTNNKIMFPNGKTSVCKNCLKELIDYDDIKSVYSVLRQMDIPFLKDYWDKATENKGDTFGAYVRMANSLHQFRGLNWNDSVFEKITSVQEGVIEDNTNNSYISQETVNRFGKGYTTEQYTQMEKFYDEMIASRDISTPEHKKLLIIMCKLQTKIDMALEEDNIPLFEKLHKQYQELIKNSGFRPIDKTASDVASGMRTFSQIFAEVERDGFIKPASITENQDIIDRTIQYMLNYQLKLLNTQTLSEPPFDTPKVSEIDE
jgi:hypothetical protein